MKKQKKQIGEEKKNWCDELGDAIENDPSIILQRGGRASKNRSRTSSHNRKCST